MDVKAQITVDIFKAYQSLRGGTATEPVELCFDPGDPIEQWVMKCFCGKRSEKGQRWVPFIDDHGVNCVWRICARALPFDQLARIVGGRCDLHSAAELAEIFHERAVAEAA